MTINNLEDLTAAVERLREEPTDHRKAYFETNQIAYVALNLILNGVENPQAIAAKALEARNIKHDGWIR